MTPDESGGLGRTKWAKAAAQLGVSVQELLDTPWAYALISKTDGNLSPEIVREYRHRRGEPARRQRSLVRWDELREAVSAKLRAERLNMTDAAAQLGLTQATLSRLLSGRTEPNLETFALLVDWLGMPPDHFLTRTGRRQGHDLPHFEHEGTPQIVASHIRADRELTEDNQRALSEAFSALYEHYRRMSARERG